jgi:asparagine synthase (glutamine-hydrolysing)
MKQFITIIHSNTRQVNERVNTMPLAHFGEEKQIERRYYNNLEMGTYGDNIAYNEQDTLWAMIDGNIYNADELHKELISKGFSFKTNSNAELIIAAYKQWKEAFLNKLTGPFALFLFDKEKQCLIIARDRMGQKSLYWSVQSRYFLVATRIKTLLATGLLPQTPALDALSSFLYFGFIPQDLTPISGINKLLPGHFLKVDLNQRWQIEQYWSLSEHFRKKEIISKNQVYDRLAPLLENSILSHIKEQSSPSLLSSDSLGSKTIAWFLRQNSLKDPNPALTALFPRSTSPSSFPLTQLTTTVTAEEIFNNLTSIIWTLDEPVADPNICLTYAMSKKAAQLHATHCLADCGYEEMLACNKRPFFLIGKSDTFASSLSFSHTLRNTLLIPISRLFGVKSTFHILRDTGVNEPLIEYLDTISLFSKKNRKKVSPTLFPYFNPEIFIGRFHRLPEFTGFSAALYFDAKTFLPDSALLQKERLLEARDITLEAPFLDHTLVEFLASLPDAIKYEDHHLAALLQKLMQHSPAQNSQPVSENQHGFFDSFQHDPLFIEHFTLLNKALIVEEGYVSLKWLKKKEPLTPQRFRQLWAILIFEIWFRLYIHTPIGSQDPKVSVKELFN